MKPFTEGLPEGTHGVQFEAFSELSVLVTGLGVLRSVFASQMPTSDMIREIDVMSQFASDMADATTEVLKSPTGDSYLNDTTPVTLVFGQQHMVHAAETAVRIVASNEPGVSTNAELQDPLKYSTAVTMGQEYAQAADEQGLRIPGYNVETPQE
ncbi:MAG TPA: hypothetical protein VLF62_06055 [Candidatus Saccharimonadales bacterium]|nr:hypothetical protein [Candidatus Saccharimonadales bacterium]